MCLLNWCNKLLLSHSKHLACVGNLNCVTINLQGRESASSKTCLTSFRSGNVWMFGLMWSGRLVAWKDWGCQKESNGYDGS